MQRRKQVLAGQPNVMSSQKSVKSTAPGQTMSDTMAGGALQCLRRVLADHPGTPSASNNATGKSVRLQKAAIVVRAGLRR